MSNATKIIAEAARRAATNQQTSIFIRTSKEKNAIPQGVIQIYAEGRWTDVLSLPLWSDAERRELATFIDAE